MFIINGWLNGQTREAIRESLGIKNHNSISAYFSKLQNMSVQLVDALLEPLGGVGKIVEIDESMFGKSE